VAGALGAASMAGAAVLGEGETPALREALAFSAAGAVAGFAFAALALDDFADFFCVVRGLAADAAFFRAAAFLAGLAGSACACAESAGEAGLAGFVDFADAGREGLGVGSLAGGSSTQGKGMGGGGVGAGTGAEAALTGCGPRGSSSA